jgi:glycosylphosphatidylinositol transamidase
LVFLCTNIYGRPHNMFQQRISTSTHRSKLQQAWEKSLIHRWLPSFGHNHVDQLLDLWNFQYILAFGPVPPHASALGQGIDALTIQLRTSSSSSASQHDVTRLVAGLEYILRALSNLHERLHHSTSLYLLLVGPSTPEDAFVKHEEYLISNILLLVPCILRAVSFVFGKTDGHGNNSSGKHSFCWATAQRAVWSTLTATVVLGMITLPQLATAVSPVGGRWRTMHNAVKTLIVLSYVPLLLLLQHTSFRWSLPDGRPVSLPTLQFVGCLLVIYTHVPLAFAHVSVGFPSAMFWSLLMAFPSYDCVGKDGDTMVAATTTKPSKLLRYAAIVLSCPAALLLLFLPANVMSNSVYLRYVYLPLHYLLAQLWQH